MKLDFATIDSRKVADTHSSRLQRTETTSELSLDKAHVHESEATLTLTGDSGHEKGGTRELKVIEEVHSTSSDT